MDLVRFNVDSRVQVDWYESGTKLGLRRSHYIFRSIPLTSRRVPTNRHSPFLVLRGSLFAQRGISVAFGFACDRPSTVVRSLVSFVLTNHRTLRTSSQLATFRSNLLLGTAERVPSLPTNRHHPLSAGGVHIPALASHTSTKPNESIVPLNSSSTL